MPLLTIAFPVFDPIAIAIGPIAIRWYALAYIGGIVLGWLYARSLIKKERLWGGPAPISLPQLDDFILWVTVGIIVGGRTGYVLFYNLAFFIQHPAEIFARRHHDRGRAHRVVSRAARQFHQQRVVGSHDRRQRALGHGVSQWRATAASPEPAL
jgi:hypothetical protein